MRVGEFETNRVYLGDCLELAAKLPENSIDVIVTSPPYWGQRLSEGVGVEEDPREYIKALTDRFSALLHALKPSGLLWINIGDSYNTPVNWGRNDWTYSTLGPDGQGFHKDNSAYTKPRLKRKEFIEPGTPWLQYGNLLALPYRLVLSLCDAGFVFRSEVIWKKKNPMPEGRCRRPHRGHEPIYLFAKSHMHEFVISPPVKTVWEFANEGLNGVRHYSRFPSELPRRCIQALGRAGQDVVVLDPFSGSATTGLVAISLGCSYIGFEVDERLVSESNDQIQKALRGEPVRSERKKKKPVGKALFD